MAVSTAQARTMFQPGQVANPKGRPKGSKNKLSEDFLKDLHDLWKRRGNQILEDLSATPAGQATIFNGVNRLIPKEMMLTMEEGNMFVINAAPQLSEQEWLAKHQLAGPTEDVQPIESQSNGKGAVEDLMRAGGGYAPELVGRIVGTLLLLQIS